MHASRFKPELIRSVSSVFLSAVIAGSVATALRQVTYGALNPDGPPLGIDGPPPFIEVVFTMLFFGGLMALLAGPLVFAARRAGEIVGGRLGVATQYGLAMLAVSSMLLLLNGGRPVFDAYSALVSIMTAAGAVAIANWLSSRDREEEPCAS